MLDLEGKGEGPTAAVCDKHTGHSVEKMTGNLVPQKGTVQDEGEPGMLSNDKQPRGLGFS